MLKVYPKCPYFDNRKGHKRCIAYTDGNCYSHDCMFKKVLEEKEKEERINTLY